MNNKWHKHQSYPTPCVRDMKTKVRLLCTMSRWNHPSRPKKKLSCFWKSAMWKSFYHLPIRLSQMCMRIYIFCFKKHTHTRTKLSLANLFVQMQVFFHPKKKGIGLFVFQQKKYWYSSFLSVKFNLIKFNSNKLIIFFFFFFFLWPPRWRFFSSPTFPETRVLFLWLNDAGLVSLMETISYIQGYN